MEKFKVGFIYNRCFIQKSIHLPSGAVITPLSQTGFVGEIHNAIRQLQTLKFAFSQKNLENTLKNFANTGHCILIRFASVEAENFISAIVLADSKW
jgi:hypothetical protein